LSRDLSRDQPEPKITNIDAVARAVTIEMPNALAVDQRGKVFDSPIHHVLQVLEFPVQIMISHVNWVS
jgi:hypothetical protein